MPVEIPLPENRAESFLALIGREVYQTLRSIEEARVCAGIDQPEASEENLSPTTAEPYIAKGIEWCQNNRDGIYAVLAMVHEAEISAEDLHLALQISMIRHKKEAAGVFLERVSTSFFTHYITQYIMYNAATGNLTALRTAVDNLFKFEERLLAE